jgi:hypothetical protein
LRLGALVPNEDRIIFGLIIVIDGDHSKEMLTKIFGQYWCFLIFIVGKNDTPWQLNIFVNVTV